jgi:hypothetical protein
MYTRLRTLKTLLQHTMKCLVHFKVFCFHHKKKDIFQNRKVFFYIMCIYLLFKKNYIL